MVNKKFIIGGVIIVAIILVFTIMSSTGRFIGFAVSSPIKTCNNVQVSYEEQEAYQEDEPYQATEEYQVPLKYEVISAQEGSTSHNFNYFKTLTVNVRNVDSETGLFTVGMTFRTLKDSGTTRDSTQYIVPSETKSFYQEYDSDLGEDVDMKYLVIPPEKTLTRIVTKYRTVTKYKPITKYRTEQRCN